LTPFNFLSIYYYSLLIAVIVGLGKCGKLLAKPKKQAVEKAGENLRRLWKRGNENLLFPIEGALSPPFPQIFP